MELSNPYRVMAEHFPQGIVFLFEERDELRYTFVDGEGLDEIGLTKDELEGTVSQMLSERRSTHSIDGLSTEMRFPLCRD